MFDNYVSAKNVTFNRWALGLVIASVVVHIVALSALVIRTYWVIHKLDIPGAQAEFATAPPPPPPPAAASKRKERPKPDAIKVTKALDVVQPDKEKVDLTKVEVQESEEEGVDEGVPDGMQGAPPPPPPKVETPSVVPPKVLEQNRIAGETQIQPPDEVKNQIRRDGKTRVASNFQICLDATGGIKGIKMLKSSGYASYDRKIQSSMSGWRYKPFMVNGEARPVCTAVTFIYSQTN